MARPHDFIVGIEQKGVSLIECTIVRRMTEHEVFEKPSRVGPMPLCRARISHGLDALVVGGQSFRQAFCLGTYSLISRDEIAARRSGSGIGRGIDQRARI